MSTTKPTTIAVKFADINYETETDETISMSNAYGQMLCMMDFLRGAGFALEMFTERLSRGTLDSQEEDFLNYIIQSLKYAAKQVEGFTPAMPLRDLKVTMDGKVLGPEVSATAGKEGRP